VSTSPSSPAALLRHLVASDPGRPRVTVYDDTDSPTRGERIELSARVLANWVAKAANLLRDDLDAGPGSVVLLDLPPHWRTLYWAFAAWSVGACVAVPANRTTTDAGHVASGFTPDVVVTDALDVAEGADEAVLVTLAALARSASVPVPAGVVDEARELATHGDVFDAWAGPPGSAPPLGCGGTRPRLEWASPPPRRPRRCRSLFSSACSSLFPGWTVHGDPEAARRGNWLGRGQIRSPAAAGRSRGAPLGAEVGVPNPRRARPGGPRPRSCGAGGRPGRSRRREP